MVICKFGETYDEDNTVQVHSMTHEVAGVWNCRRYVMRKIHLLMRAITGPQRFAYSSACSLVKFICKVWFRCDSSRT
jgi:hypothetical protein